MDRATADTSHPARVRGLKQAIWRRLRPTYGVAPCTGAWIETRHACREGHGTGSHPARVRGLKPARADGDGDGIQSHPARVRGLKQQRAADAERDKRRTLHGCVD